MRVGLARLSVATVTVPRRVGAFTFWNEVHSAGTVLVWPPMLIFPAGTHSASVCARMSFSLAVMSLLNSSVLRPLLSGSHRLTPSTSGHHLIAAG